MWTCARTRGRQQYNEIIDIKTGTTMASITLRNLDEQTKERLRVRAGRQGRSMEEEARNILRTALAQDTRAARNLARAIRTRFEPLGGVELELPAREPMRETPRPSK
jgi:plasmid stability protein